MPSDLPPTLRQDYLEFESVLLAGSTAFPVRAAAPTDAHEGGGIARTPATAEALSLLLKYGRLVHDSAKSLALISGGDRSSIYTRHILDSLNPLVLFGTPPKSAVDIGSGAGFPGIPLAIAWPEALVTLLESREKKAGFLERAVRQLGLKNVRVVCARLEDDEVDWRVGPAESVFVRAVRDLPDLLTHAAHRAKPGGRWLYFLGARTSEEAMVAPLAARGFSATVVPGSFGGRILTGTFEP